MTVGEVFRIARMLGEALDFIIPDTSVLQYALPRNQMTPRDKDFPYDETNDEEQWPVNSRGRGDDMRTPSHHGIVPRDTAHTQWDDGDGVDEAMGTPMNFTQSTMGGGAMGSNVAGVNQGWANNPAKGWDEDDTEERLAAYGEEKEIEEGGPLSMHPGLHDVPQPEPIPSPDFHGTSDEEIETDLDKIYGRNDNPEFKNDGSTGNFPSIIGVVMAPGGPFKMGVGNAGRPSRGMYGQIPKESAWKGLSNLLESEEIKNLK